MKPMRILLQATLVLAAACSGTTRAPTGAATDTVTAADLAGRWNLTQVCGGFAGGCTTTLPGSEPQLYTFHADGTVDVLIDGQAVSGTFAIAEGTVLGQPAEVMELRLTGRSSALFRVELTTDGALLLSEPYMDGYTLDYRKAP